MPDHLPKYVYPRKRRSAYIWRPYTPDQPRKEIRLCSLDAPISEVWRKWEALQRVDQITPMTLEWLLNEYRDSARFTELAAMSQKQIRSRISVICNFPTSVGRFGTIYLDKITPGVLTRFLEEVVKDGGGSTSRANTFRNTISSAWKWALSRDVITLKNPAIDARSFPTQKSDRFVTVEEYDLFYRLAKESKYKWLPSFMEIAYICRLRTIEVINLRHEDCVENGIICNRVKGSKTNIVGWSDRLRAAIMEGSEWLVHWKDGSQLTSSRIHQGWTSVMKQDAYNLPHFTRHALKARGISNTPLETRRGSAGHRSEASVAVYDRALDLVEPVE